MFFFLLQEDVIVFCNDLKFRCKDHDEIILKLGTRPATVSDEDGITSLKMPMSGVSEGSITVSEVSQPHSDSDTDFSHDVTVTTALLDETIKERMEKMNFAGKLDILQEQCSPDVSAPSATSLKAPASEKRRASRVKVDPSNMPSTPVHDDVKRETVEAPSSVSVDKSKRGRPRKKPVDTGEFVSDFGAIAKMQKKETPTPKRRRSSVKGQAADGSTRKTTKGRKRSKKGETKGDPDNPILLSSPLKQTTAEQQEINDKQSDVFAFDDDDSDDPKLVIDV